MTRYLEEQGVLRPDRGPDDRGHRHFPPPELELARVAAAALKAGSSIDGLATVRRLADRRVEAARADPDPLAWFELLAIARAVDRILQAQAAGRPAPLDDREGPHGPRTKQGPGKPGKPGKDGLPRRPHDDAAGAPVSMGPGRPRS